MSQTALVLKTSSLRKSFKVKLNRIFLPLKLVLITLRNAKRNFLIRVLSVEQIIGHLMTFVC